MAKPLVAIVGRPNVGKSMLFNKLTGHRTSIVEDTPGVTRDRIYGDCEWCGRTFALVITFLLIFLFLYLVFCLLKQLILSISGPAF